MFSSPQKILKWYCSLFWWYRYIHYPIHESIMRHNSHGVQALLSQRTNSCECRLYQTFHTRSWWGSFTPCTQTYPHTFCIYVHPSTSPVVSPCMVWHSVWINHKHMKDFWKVVPWVCILFLMYLLLFKSNAINGMLTKVKFGIDNKVIATNRWYECCRTYFF